MTQHALLTREQGMKYKNICISNIVFLYFERVFMYFNDFPYLFCIFNVLFLNSERVFVF